MRRLRCLVHYDYMEYEQTHGTAVTTAEAAQAPHEIKSAVFSATHAPQELNNSPSTATASSAISVADQVLAPHGAASVMIDAMEFNLTVAQAREMFARHSRKIPAERTLQHHCGTGLIAAQKIRTSFGSEWLINEGSLMKHIRKQPVISEKNEVPPRAEAQAPQIMAAAAHAAPVIGETRTLAQLLIENARLMAEREGKVELLAERDKLIATLQDEREFLRNQVTTANRMSEHALSQGDRLLETLQVMRLGSGTRNTPEQQPSNDAIRYERS